MAGSKATPFSGKGSVKPLPQITVNEYKYGTISFLEPQDIPRGAAAVSLNWRTQGSKIETRPGYMTLGSNVPGVGKVQGIYTAHKWDGTEILFACKGGDLYYYNTAISDWTKIGNQLFGGAAINDLVYMAEYFSPSGAQFWVSSPNSKHLIKIMTANPGDYKDQFASTLNYCGYFHISESAMFMWNYKDQNGNGSVSTLRRSYIDNEAYTSEANESAGTGDGATKIFTYTLAGVSGNGSAFGLQVSGPIAATVNISGVSATTAATVDTSGAHGLVVGDWVYFTGLGGMTQMNGLLGIVQQVNSSTEFLVTINSSDFTAYTSGGTMQRVEMFTDDYLGNLKSNLGGTGTVNYTTGATSVTFNAAPVNSGGLLANYQVDNPLNKGIADFEEAFNNDGSRQAGSGTFFLEGHGGALMFDAVYDGVHYPIHEWNIWSLTISTDDDDTKLVNLPYRENLSILSPRGSVSTGDGIYFVNTRNVAWPYLALIKVNEYGTMVLPSDVSSDKFNMSGYLFDQAVLYQAAVVDAMYIIICCRTANSPVNNRMILYNMTLDCFDVMDFYASCLTVYQGILVGGDSVTQNVYQFFTGYDDDGVVPYALWAGNIDNYGIEILKKTKQFWIEGEIDINQSAQVWAALDHGNFVLVGTIYGDGTYVDQSSSIMIGSNPIGSTPVGGSFSGATVHNHYLTQMRLRLDKFQYVQVMYIPLGIGYFSVSSHVHMDIRLNTNHLPQKYRTTPPAAVVLASTLNQNALNYDLSPYLNGSTIVFTIPANLGVLSITSSSSPFAFRQGVDFTISDTTLTFSNTVNAASMLASGFTIVVVYTPAPPIQTPPIASYDLSALLNGVSAAFTIPTNEGILDIRSSSAPFTFRPGIDYIVSGTTLTFLATITPAVTLAAGQSLIILYYE